MSVNYLFKLKEYMTGIGLQDYTIDIEDFCAKEALILFDKLWENKEQIRDNLVATMKIKKDTLAKDILIVKNI
jgi:hypothetical protein